MRAARFLGAYAEYDAVPANNQDQVPYEKPRDGVHRAAAGHTDPHSALGIGSVGAVLATKAAMEKHGLAGTLVLFGEPAEKVCGSKPVHAAHGYYDGFDAYWSRLFTFECTKPESWNQLKGGTGTETAHTVARAPGALDAVCLMYTTTKYTKETMLPHTGYWTLNEAVLSAGQATADNLPPRIGQIQYSWRTPTLDMQEAIAHVLENNAEHVAGITHTKVDGTWITKTRVGLANTALAELAWRNLELVGPPEYGEEAVAFGREIQRNLGIEPADDPFIPEFSTLADPKNVEERVRAMLPDWQRNWTSDDYVEFTWHAPAMRLYIGRPMLRPPEPGYEYPAWVWNVLGGHAPSIDPMIYCASRAVAGTLVDLLTQPEELARARAEFDERTAGGIGGDRWVAPLLPEDFCAPVDFRWPEYITTTRGEEWWIPTTDR